MNGFGAQQKWVSEFRVKELDECLQRLGLPRSGKKMDKKERLLSVLNSGQDGGSESLLKDQAASVIQEVYSRMNGVPFMPHNAAADGLRMLANATARAPRSGHQQQAPGPQRWGSGLQQGARRVQTACICTSTGNHLSCVTCSRCGKEQHQECMGVGDVGSIKGGYFCHICRMETVDPFWHTTEIKIRSARPSIRYRQAMMSKPTQWLDLNLSLSDRQELEALHQSRDKFALQVHCFLLGDPTLLRNHWPLNTKLTVNGVELRVYPRAPSTKLGPNGRDEPASIGAHIFAGRNKVQLECGDSRPFVLAVRKARRRSMQEVQALMLPQETPDAAFERVKRQVAGTTDGGEKSDEDDDLLVESTFVSLRDPLSFLRISTPARFVDTKGVAVFDLHGFLEMASRNCKWQCPFSLQASHVGRLQVCSYMQHVLKQLALQPDVVEVEVGNDGRWRAKGSPQWHSVFGSNGAEQAAQGAPEANGSQVKLEPLAEASAAPRLETGVNAGGMATLKEEASGGATESDNDEEEDELEELRRVAKEYASTHKRPREDPPPEVIVIDDSDDEDQPVRPVQRPRGLEQRQLERVSELRTVPLPRRGSEEVRVRMPRARAAGQPAIADMLDIVSRRATVPAAPAPSPDLGTPADAPGAAAPAGQPAEGLPPPLPRQPAAPLPGDRLASSQQASTGPGSWALVTSGPLTLPEPPSDFVPEAPATYMLPPTQPATLQSALAAAPAAAGMAGSQLSAAAPGGPTAPTAAAAPAEATVGSGILQQSPRLPWPPSSMPNGIVASSPSSYVAPEPFRWLPVMGMVPSSPSAQTESGAALPPVPAPLPLQPSPAAGAPDPYRLLGMLPPTAAPGGGGAGLPPAAPPLGPPPQGVLVEAQRLPPAPAPAGSGLSQPWAYPAAPAVAAAGCPTPELAGALPAAMHAGRRGADMQQPHPQRAPEQPLPALEQQGSLAPGLSGAFANRYLEQLLERSREQQALSRLLAGAVAGGGSSAAAAISSAGMVGPASLGTAEAPLTPALLQRNPWSSLPQLQPALRPPSAAGAPAAPAQPMHAAGPAILGSVPQELLQAMSHRLQERSLQPSAIPSISGGLPLPGAAPPPHSALALGRHAATITLKARPLADPSPASALPAPSPASPPPCPGIGPPGAGHQPLVPPAANSGSSLAATLPPAQFLQQLISDSHAAGAGGDSAGRPPDAPIMLD